METPQDPLAVYFRDNIFPGFTSSFLLHLRPISLCLLHRREITDLLFTTACSVLPVLENLPVSHQLPSRLLFCRQSNLQVLSLGACPLDLLSFWLPSSPLPKWMGLSWRAALQIEHRAPAERSPAWRLLPEGCTPRSIPVPCFALFPFCYATAQHHELMFNWRIHAAPTPSWRVAVPPVVPTARWTLWSSTPLPLTSPLTPGVPWQRRLTKGIVLCVVLN